MNRILQTGRTGLDSIQRKMDTIAHNISNVQTTGFKKLDVQFEDLVYDQVANRGVPLTPEGREKPIEIGTGSRIKSIMHRFEQGNLQQTSRPLDLAINGEGFFGVVDENGQIQLTRDGTFMLDGNGALVDSRGRHVSMEVYSPLSQWKEEDINVDENGLLTSRNEAGDIITVGKLILYDVPDKAMLRSMGNNYFSVADQADIYAYGDNQPGGGKIMQGYLEGSSVDIAEELVDMFITQRAYQINTKSIHAADEMWSMVNQLRR